MYKKVCAEQWLRKLVQKFLYTVFSVALPFHRKPGAIRNFLKTPPFFSRFGMVPRLLAPARAMKSRTCADVIQPCRREVGLLHLREFNAFYWLYLDLASWPLNSGRGHTILISVVQIYFCNIQGKFAKQLIQCRSAAIFKLKYPFCFQMLLSKKKMPPAKSNWLHRLSKHCPLFLGFGFSVTRLGKLISLAFTSNNPSSSAL